jgi:CDGSH-type Zn-finger protein
MDDQPHIGITSNGPYVVHGDVPLTEMAPVHTFNGEPIAWHTVRSLVAPSGTVELCRCGQSANKPFCDNSHLQTPFDGAETADRRPFKERASEERSGQWTIADDGALCVSAGFCGTRTTNVWKLLEETSDPEKFARMQEMIWHCPSGRLVLGTTDSDDSEPQLEPGIAVLPGGPLWIRGGIRLVGEDGTEWETRNRMTLCRCGQSNNKPFCDRSHEAMHFDER